MGTHSGRSNDEELDPRAFERGFKETEGALLIDVRTPQEYEETRIPGARNIDIHSPDFTDEIQAIDREAPIFLYCRSGNRSGTALDAMKQMGFSRVVHLADGILGWDGETE